MGGVYNIFRVLENDDTLAAFGNGVLAALGASVLGYGIKEFVNGYKANKSLEKEIADLKSDPQYRAFVEDTK